MEAKNNLEHNNTPTRLMDANHMRQNVAAPEPHKHEHPCWSGGICIGMGPKRYKPLWRTRRERIPGGLQLA